MKRGRKFYLNRGDGKVMGVCAGLADYTGWDATWIRVGAVLITIAGAFPWTLIAYGVAAWMAKPKPMQDYEAELIEGLRANRRQEFRSDMRDIDRRLADIETYVTSPNSRLEREIEELR